jgi:nucleoid DNA-binding protein
MMSIKAMANHTQRGAVSRGCSCFMAIPLAKGETVKLASFGSFIVRKKSQRLGRNPKTGVEVAISPRRVIVFKPSAILKQQVNGKRSDTKTPVEELGSLAPAS